MRRLLHAMTLLALGVGLMVSTMPPAAAHKGGSAAHQKAHKLAAKKRAAKKRTTKRTVKKATHTMHGKTMPGMKHHPGMKH